MDDVGRTAAILGADVRAAKLNEPAALVNDSAVADAPKPAPVTPVLAQPLPGAIIEMPTAKSAPEQAPAPTADGKTSARDLPVTTGAATADSQAPRFVAKFPMIDRFYTLAQERTGFASLTEVIARTATLSLNRPATGKPSSPTQQAVADHATGGPAASCSAATNLLLC
jgi:hypothetical protein